MKRLTLYETFVKTMEEFLGTFENEDVGKAKEKGDENSSKSPTKSDIFIQNVYQQMQIKEVKDPLLRLNFERIFSVHELKPETLTEKEEQVER